MLKGLLKFCLAQPILPQFSLQPITMMMIIILMMIIIITFIQASGRQECSLLSLVQDC